MQRQYGKLYATDHLKTPFKYPGRKPINRNGVHDEI
jgi:hypothetical protein